MREPVRKIRDDQLREAQGTPGLTRRVAFEADGHWFGHVGNPNPTHPDVPLGKGTQGNTTAAAATPTTTD